MVRHVLNRTSGSSYKPIDDVVTNAATSEGMRSWHLGVIFLAAVSSSVHAIGQDRCALFEPSKNAFPIVSSNHATSVLISEDEWPGVQIAANDFVHDIHNVTGVLPKLLNASSIVPRTSTVVIVGTLGQSSLINTVINNTKLDVSGIEGQWEAFMSTVVRNPLPGVQQAYVIIGADKRGTIFGLYDHSEQFGTLAPLRVTNTD